MFLAFPIVESIHPFGSQLKKFCSARVSIGSPFDDFRVSALRPDYFRIGRITSAMCRARKVLPHLFCLIQERLSSHPAKSTCKDWAVGVYFRHWENNLEIWDRLEFPV